MTTNISNLAGVPSLNVSATYDAIKSAKAKLADQKEEIVQNIIKFLQANPNTYVTASDLASKTGMRPCVVAKVMQYRGGGIRTETIRVERKYAELDNDGYVIPGSERTKTVKRVAYIYYDNERKGRGRRDEMLPF